MGLYKQCVPHPYMWKGVRIDLSFQLYFQTAFPYGKESAMPIRCNQCGLRDEERIISFPGKHTPAA